MNDSATRHTVICTAGHIDHGKSALIFSLTGTHPDTLKEEMEREMTIDLGFAFYGANVTFIDVPGHEKFIKTMLAGASGVDGALLVIAADDGVMPQTREHFEVLQLLGVKTGVIALTKIDLADQEWIELVREEIRSLVAGSFLQDAPIIPVSNKSGEGIPELRRELDLMIRGVNPRRDRGLFRMWVDRSFTIKGSGTVVAGTVLSGKIKVGDRIEILPAKIPCRIKRMQIHKAETEFARIGERVALNLPGVNKDAVKRGDLAATPDHFQPTFMINARLTLLASAPRLIENRTRLRLHLGSSEHFCRVILLDRTQLVPGDSSYAQLRLEEPGVTDVGDQLVIRAFSEGRVIGGGVVLEVHPDKLKSASPEMIARLARLESAQPAEIVRQFVQRKGDLGCDAASIAREASLFDSEAVDILAALHRDGDVVQIAPAPKWIVVDRQAWESLHERIVTWLSEYHTQYPQSKGARRSEVKAKAASSASTVVLDQILEHLTEEGSIALEGELIRLTSHKPSFSAAQEELRKEIDDIFLNSRFNPPDSKTLANDLGKSLKEIESILAGLVESGQLVRLYDPEGVEIIYHRESINEARRILITLLNEQSEFRFFEYREKLGSTRKYTTPLAILFDGEGLTYRDGEVRRRGGSFPVSSIT